MGNLFNKLTILFANCQNRDLIPFTGCFDNANLLLLLPAEKIEFTEVPGNSVVTEGAHHVLLCAATGLPEPSISWFKVLLTEISCYSWSICSKFYLKPLIYNCVMSSSTISMT